MTLGLILWSALCMAQGVYEISGRVLDAGSGAPISKARVTVQAHSQGQQRTVEVLTDAAGGFRILNVPAGSHYVSCSRSGYLAEQSTRYRATASVQLGTTAAPGPVTLYLLRHGVIEGTALSDSERHVNGSVRAYRLALQDGRYKPVDGGSSGIDSTGAFRLGGLRPGRYYFAFVADHYGAKSGLTYRPVFYPGSPDIAGAKLFVINAGSEEHLDFRAAPEPGYTISGKLMTQSEGIGLTLRPVERGGLDLQQHFPLDWKRAEQTFSYSGVPAGEYLLQLNQYENGQQTYAEQRISVSGNVAGIVLQPRLLTPLAVTVTAENAAGPRMQSAPFHLAKEGNANSHFPSLEKDGSFTLKSLIPGTYSLRNGTGSPAVVVAVRQGGRDALDEGVIVPADRAAEPLEVVTSTSAARVEGFIDVPERDNENFITVMFLRKHGDNFTIQQQTTAQRPGVNRWYVRLPSAPASQDGRMRFHPIGLSPGEYLVLAWPHASGQAAQLPYNTPEFHSQYGSLAERIKVGTSGTHQVTIRRLLPIEAFEP